MRDPARVWGRVPPFGQIELFQGARRPDEKIRRALSRFGVFEKTAKKT